MNGYVVSGLSTWVVVLPVLGRERGLVYLVLDEVGLRGDWRGQGRGPAGHLSIPQASANKVNLLQYLRSEFGLRVGVGSCTDFAKFPKLPAVYHPISSPILEVSCLGTHHSDG